MLLNIEHKTRYSYDDPVDYALQQLRLTPKSRPGHEVLSWETSIEGGTKQVAFDDQHNNHVDLVSFNQGATEIVITSRGQVQTSDNHGIIGSHGGFIPLWFFQRPTELTRAGNGVRALIRQLPAGSVDDPVKHLHALSGLIVGHVRYETGKTHAETSAEDALHAGHGVCQDHAHIFVTAARQMGFPARYVSGYLMMNDRVEQDASHAWAEAHIDDLGWVGFDVSNGISPDERYVRVATGLDYRDAAPISGVRFGAGREDLIVSLQVQQ